MRAILRNFLISATVSVSAVTAGLVVGLTPDEALAGPSDEEMWFGTGADSLETGENGRVTEEGAKTKTKEVDRIPDEDDWELKIHARMGKHAAEGPLYIEFYQTVNGQEYIVYRHEDAEYGGERNYNQVVLLEANIGFNKNREYRVQIIQNNGKRDLTLAKGKVTLIDTGRTAQVEGEEEGEEEEGEEDEDEDEGEDEDDEEEDEDEGGEGEGGEEGPPPVEPQKKGCTVTEGGAADLGATGLGILLLAGALRRRRD